MRFLIAALAFVAVAVASPVQPGVAGPAQIVDNYEPIVIGPALIDNYQPIVVGPALVDNFEPIVVGPAVVEDFEQISVGPAVVEDFEQISVGPAVVEDFEQISVGPAVAAPAASAPLVQIVLNINQQTHVVDVPMPIETPAIVPTPVIFVEDAVVAGVPEVVPVEVAPAPAEIIEVAPVPVEIIEVAPVEVGTPLLPTPIIN